MQVILSDHNCLGQAKAIFNVLRYDGIWLELVPMELHTFTQAELDGTAPDQTVWERCQERGYILLTGNRSGADGKLSLEHVIRELVTPESLPVLTIGNLKRVMKDRDYCIACAESMAEIVHNLDNCRGVMRLFLP